MNFNSSLKKIICFLLAVLMLLSTAGCTDKGGKKKVVKKIKKKVVVVNNDEQTDNSGNNDIIVEDDTTEGDSNETVKVRPKRPLPETAEDEEEYVEPIVPEFEYDYATLNITNDYVIVYSNEKWTNRYESRNKDGSARAVTETGFSRLAAYDLRTYFNEQLGLELEVSKDTEINESATKKIILKVNSSLSENEFAVKVSGEDLVFEGGHFAMVEKAVDWYRTVEVKDGKVAVLSGKQDDFKSTVTLNGVTYDYVWGDEFDGYEFNDYDKWVQGTFGLERQDDMANVFNDTRFQYVENGRLRLTGDRYYDEGNGKIGYATSGQIDTNGVMLFRNGYFEFRARLPYTRGAFPAIWTMTCDAEGLKNVPNWDYDDGYGIYKNRVWDLEFDLFESFADTDHMSTTIHKWYKGGAGITTINQTLQPLTLEEQLMVENDMVEYRKTYKSSYSTPINYTYKDGEETKQYYYYVDASGNMVTEITEEKKAELIAADASMADKIKPHYARYQTLANFEDGAVDIFKYRLSPYVNMGTSHSTYAYSMSYADSLGVNHGTPGTYNWQWYFDPATINQEYHIYAFHYTTDHCTVFMDGEPFIDFDWDPAYDYKDLDGDGKGDDISRNNNGVGFNFWQYFLIDMMIYTPGNFKIDDVLKIQEGDVPLNLYIDYIRCYQDLDDNSQGLYFPNGEAK